jgi:hypothetical protein
MAVVPFYVVGRLMQKREQALPAVNFSRSSSVGNAVRNCSMSTLTGHANIAHTRRDLHHRTDAFAVHGT